MALEQLKAEICLLLNELSEHPHDRYEIEFMLRAKLAELKAFGLPLPVDLATLDIALDHALTHEARKRSVPTR